MSKLHLCLLIGVLALIGAAIYGSATGQTAGPVPATRVAVCDLESLYANYTRARDMVAKLNQSSEALKAEDQERARAIDALKMELEGLREDSQEFQDRLSEVQRLGVEREAWRQITEQNMLREHNRLTLRMYDEITAAIQAVAQQQGIQIVLFKQNPSFPTRDGRDLLDQIRSRKVLYSEPGVDITPQVLVHLNDAYRAKGQTQP
jgi:Skp family chaperone for outer membrane proteins